MSRTGDFLERYQDKLGITQRALADKLKISYSHMSYLLNGKMPSIENNRQVELKTLNDILTGLEEQCVTEFLECYLADIVADRFHKFLPGKKSSIRDDAAPYQSKVPPSIKDLFDQLQASGNPTKISKQLIEVVKRTKGRPDYIPAIMKILEAV